MIGLLLGTALAAPVDLDRVDLLSEASGSWLHDELPRAGSTPTVVGLRYLEQVQVVVGLPEGFELGLGARTQAIRLERPTGAGPWRLNGGLQLAAGLPMGVVGGVAWRRGVVRVGASLSVTSSASWARPVWDGWRTLPVLGLGFGPAPAEASAGGKAPWMRD